MRRFTDCAHCCAIETLIVVAFPECVKFGRYCTNLLREEICDCVLIILHVNLSEF